MENAAKTVIKAKPYVGITGLVTGLEVESIIKEFKNAGYDMNTSTHTPMLGFLVSYETLTGQPTTNRRYPKIENLTSLLMGVDNAALTMIHYNSKEMSSLARQVSSIFNRLYYADFCRAIQFNIVWPDGNQVILIKKKFPKMKIVLQASHEAMVDKTPKEIVDKISPYQDFVDYVLIDPSRGRGPEFDINSSLDVYNELKERVPNLTVGFAGGFSGNNVVDRVRTTISKIQTTDFCIDAEGGLRDKITEEYGDDTLNIEKVRNYLQAASSILK